LKEELRAGKTLHAAIDAGFNRAFTSIFDSNVTTWITCAVLYYLGAPIIKGFALTLALGVAVSMFTAIVVTRTMLHMVVNFPWARNEKLFGLGISWLSNRFGEGRWLNVLGARRIYLGISVAMLVASIGFLATGGLKPGIDFTGGSVIQVVYRQPVPREQIETILKANGLKEEDYLLNSGNTSLADTTVTVVVKGDLPAVAKPDVRKRLELVRPGAFDETQYRETADAAKKTLTATAVYYTTPQQPVTREQVQSTLANANLKPADDLPPLAKLPSVEITAAQSKTGTLPLWVVTSHQIGDAPARALDKALMELGGGYIKPASSRQTIGPSIAKEVTLNAFSSMAVASLLIILYLAFRFSIGGFVNGLKFGVCAVVALIHDVLFVVGVFALMGYLRGWQVDSLFVTAALTIVGFSVHDTIVVYDRIRENLRNRLRGETFEDVANRSITQTFDRSINTSLTVVLVLVALVVFGGSSIHGFSIALLIGIAVGTYSSIFVASPLVVLLERWTSRAVPATAAAGRGGTATGRSGGRTDVALRPRPDASPRRATAPRETVASNGETNGQAADGDGSVGTARPARPTATSGGSTIKPKRKRRS
jgi:preprotein translocase SecF subunit